MTLDELLLGGMDSGPPPNLDMPMGAEMNPFSMPPEPPGFPPLTEQSPQFALPPPPQRARPKLPSKKEQEKIQEYAAKFIKDSTDYVKKKVWMWSLWDALYEDTITQNQWREWRSKGRNLSTSLARVDIAELLPDTEDSVPTDYVHNPAYLVDAFAAHAYPFLFDGPEYITVLAPTEKGGPEMPGQESSFGLDQRVQRLLCEKLEQNLIHSRIYECLTNGPKYGTVFGKASWHRDYVPVDYVAPNPIDPTKEEIVQRTWEVVREGPIIEEIPLERAIVDPQARHSDVQRWRGVGHWVEKSYAQVLQGFKNGLYSLNEAEFKKRFKDGQTQASNDEEVSSDPDRDTDATADGFIRIYELHIKAPTDEGLSECVIKLCCFAGQDDVTDGLLIDLVMGHALFEFGARPFAIWQYGRKNGPFGKGEIEKQESNLYLLSQFMGQAQENARTTCNPARFMLPDIIEYLNQHHNKKVPYDGLIPLVPGFPPNEQVAPIPQSNFPAQLVLETINDLRNTLERASTSADVPVAGSAKEQTATGMGILQQQGQMPVRTKIDVFAREFLTPLANCALALLKENLSGDQQITMQDASGRDVMSSITQEELQGGKFRVVATITRQDATKTVQANIIKDLLQNVFPVIEPMLFQEGMKPMYGVGVKRTMDLLSLSGSDQILKQFSSYEQQLLQRIQMLEQQVMQMQQMAAQPPGQNGNGQVPAEKAPGDNGGPMGSMPSDANSLALQYQMAQEPNMGFE